jgi:hypothetical protein
MVFGLEQLVLPSSRELFPSSVSWRRTGLPDGIFLTKKSQFG